MYNFAEFNRFSVLILR